MAKREPGWPEALEGPEIPGLIRLEFDFLASEFSFEPAVPTASGSILYAQSYRRGAIAVEPMVDRKDAAIEVDLSRWIDGVAPGNRDVDASGRLVRTRLFVACWQRKVPSSKAGPARGLAPADQVRALLRAEAETLRRHFPDVLAGSDAIFAEMDESRRQRAAKRARAEYFEDAERLFREGRLLELAQRLADCPYPLSRLWQARLRYARRRSAD
jgi:hypothetical protein